MSTKIILCFLALIVGLLGSSLLGLWPQGSTAGFVSEAHAASVSPFLDSEDFTFVAWVYWEGGDDWQRIFELSRNAERNMYLTPNPAGAEGMLRFAITTSGDVAEQQLNASEPLPQGQWVHVAVTLAGDTGQLYLNGVSVDSGTITLNPNQVTGAQRWLAKSQYDWDPTFKGRLDEVAVFDRALSLSEIQQIIASGWDSLSGKTLALHMDENPADNETQITDSSGQANHGTLFTDEGDNHSYEGKVGRALFFDGNTDHLALPAHPLVPDVQDQYANLQPNGDPLAFHLGVGDDPSVYRHYQGMARFTAADGTPYIILVRSGSHTDGPGCTPDDYPGELLIVRMGSRDKDGERLRSNRLGPDWMGDTLPDPEEDKAVMHFHFNGQYGWPKYSHPSGLQLVGDVLVVPLEHHCTLDYQGDDYLGDCGDIDVTEVYENVIALIDVADLIERGSLAPGETIIKDFYVDGYKVGPLDHALPVVGVTYVPERGQYLFIMGADGGPNTLKFAWSDTADLKTTSKLELETFTWDRAYLGVNEEKWGEDANYLTPIGTLKHQGWQMLNGVRDKDGRLYLIGSVGCIYPYFCDDWTRLFQVDVAKLNSLDYQQAISFVDEKKLDLGHPKMGNLAAAAGVYVSPTGNLILYTGPHAEIDDTTYIEMGEFRNIDVYHPDTEAAKTMCPWAELYNNTWGWLGDAAPDGLERSVMYDFVDRDLDTWNNLDLEDFDGETSAIRWYLKPGQMLRLYEDAYFGGQYHPYNFYSGLGSYGDLSGPIGGISSFFMGPFADPGGPYSGDEGSSIPLYGANRCYSDTDPEFNSPILRWRWSASDCNISGSDRQPTLTCEDNDSIEVTAWIEMYVGDDWIALTDPSSTQVTVRNVAPVVTAIGTIDENRLATVSGTITDPGTLDTFNLTIDWGGGAVGPIPYPAGTTTYSATHEYQITTLEVHTVTVTVADKDGGIGTASTSINVEGGMPIYLPLIVKGSQ